MNPKYYKCSECKQIGVPCWFKKIKTSTWFKPKIDDTWDLIKMPDLSTCEHKRILIEISIEDMMLELL